MNTINPLKVIFPFYHSVSDIELPHLKYLYRVKTAAEFRKDLDTFLKYYKPVVIDDLIAAAKNKQAIRERSFLITFDDGFRQVHDVVVPILKEKGIPAVFFLNPAFLNNKELFYRCKASILVDVLQNKPLSQAQQKRITAITGKDYSSAPNLIKFIKGIDHRTKSILDELALALEFSFDAYLKHERPYLTDDQVNNIIKEGFVIGSHGMDHIKFNELEYPNQIQQVKESLEYLNIRYALKYKLFSFPFTDYGVSDFFFQNIYNEKNPLVDLSFGTAGMKSDIPQNLQRIPMEKFPYPASCKLLFQYFYWLLKIPFGKNQIKRN
jgi:peptidoglycan/xylan/chitin deacetylase (PgdA/CDA1 family)